MDCESQPAYEYCLLVSRLCVIRALYTCRPDLVGFINCLPLVVIELRKPGMAARGVRREPDAQYGGNSAGLLVQRVAHRLERHGQPRQLARGGLGTVCRGPRRTGAQRIEREDAPRRMSLEGMIRGTCAIADPEGSRLLDLVENFTLFSEHKTELVKPIGQNHQFLGVNNRI